MQNRPRHGLHPDHDVEAGTWEYIKNQIEIQIHIKGLELKEMNKQLAIALEKIPLARKDVRDLENRINELRKEEKLFQQANKDAREELRCLVEQSMKLQHQHEKTKESYEAEKEDWVNLKLEVSQMMTMRSELMTEKQKLQITIADLHSSLDNLEFTRQSREFEQKEISKALESTREEYTMLRGEIQRLEIKSTESVIEDDKWTENQNELLKTTIMVQESQAKLQKKLDRYRMAINEILDNKWNEQIVQESTEKISFMQIGLDQCIDRHSRDMQKLKRNLIKKTRLTN